MLSSFKILRKKRHLGGIHFLLGLLVLGLVACHPGKRVQNPENKPTQPTAAVRPPTPQPKPIPTEAAKTAAEAVEKGINFLSHSAWEFEYVYLYTYLQPQYNWPNLPAQARTAYVRDSLQRKGDQMALVTLHEMDLFGRLLDPQYRINATLLASAEELDSVTVPALYCDVFQLDTAQYFPILRGEAGAGGYRATHALLCYVWMKENGCLGVAAAGRLDAQIILPNVQMIRDAPNYWSDLNIEAAALLRAAKQPFPDNWIAGIVQAQRPDGGWSTFPNGDKSETHPTILALWFLAGL